MCKSLEEITLPEGLTSIGQNAFSACLILEKITVPASFNMDLLLNVGLPENIKITLLPPKLADQGVPQKDSLPQSIARLFRNIYQTIRRFLKNLFNLQDVTHFDVDNKQQSNNRVQATDLSGSGLDQAHGHTFKLEEYKKYALGEKRMSN